MSSPPVGGCSQCIGVLCFAAPCNMDCRIVGDGCETIIMGRAYTPYDPKTEGDDAVFFIQQVEKCNSLMTKAGIEVGDTIIRVNGQFANGATNFEDLKVIGFAELVCKMDVGMRLDCIRPSGHRYTVML